MDQITIREATAFTCKSEATIRRLLKKALAKKPKKASKKQGIWFIDKEFLINEFSIKPSGQEAETNRDPQENITIKALIKQLEIKDQQITELNNRLQEANILHKQLQDHWLETKQITDKKPNIFRRFLGKS
jgi:lipopolysaccharide export LptBFGC system permease protein LptF